MLEARAKGRRELHGLKEGQKGLIIVDYLQLMQPGPMTANKSTNDQVSEISRGLKILAKEMNMPVLALSQLSRAIEQRGKDKRPMLSDLRDSGAIEQDADIVMFIDRSMNESRRKANRAPIWAWPSSSSRSTATVPPATSTWPSIPSSQSSWTSLTTPAWAASRVCSCWRR